MQNTISDKPCLCGSHKKYAHCCEKYHIHQAYPETAEALMRSRYVAFALHLKSYLLLTWSEKTRPGNFEFENGLSWQKLDIIDVQNGQKNDPHGRVHFKATYQIGFERGILEEISQFSREAVLINGVQKTAWVYLSGKIIHD